MPGDAKAVPGKSAEVDGRSARKTVGHADQAMTSHYTHIGAQAHRAAAEAVAALVDGKDRIMNECSLIVPCQASAGSFLTASRPVR
jgi:hypothetical protein